MDFQLWAWVWENKTKRAFYQIQLVGQRNWHYCIFAIFAALAHQWNYIVDVVVNASDAETFGLFRDSLNAVIFPLQLDNNTHLTDVSITTGIESMSQ